MNENSTLYWTSLKKYEDCPQAFLWTYGWGDIDLGQGPGKGRALPEKKSAHHAMMGSVIQAVIEAMYNDELWRDPKNLLSVLMTRVEIEWLKHSKKPRNWIDYAEAGMSEDEMIQTCKDGVQGYLKTMKAHKLLGEYAKAEVDLIGWVNKYLKVGGKADVIIRRDKDTGITILDGKNSKTKGRFTDPDQLRWYALVFKLAYKESPNRLGFVYYRFPYGAETFDPSTGESTLEEGVEWVPFTEDDLRGLALRAQEARDGMRKEKFPASPSPSKCEYCDFLSVCEARQSQRKDNAEKRGPRETKKIEELGSSGGFVDFSL